MITFNEIEPIDGNRRFELVENKRIGLAVMGLNKKGSGVEIKSIEIWQKQEQYYDFFVRCVLNVLRDMDIKICTHVNKEYFVKFGFDADGQIASGKSIDFSGECSGKGE